MRWKPNFFNGFKRSSIASVRSNGFVEEVKIVVIVIIKTNLIKIYADCNNASEYIL